MVVPEYPKRPSFFAYRFCRLMAKVCLANDVGPGVCWLLTTIAMTEDAKGYRGPVTFFNEQLMAVTGFNSDDALDRSRKKAIAAGWLHYIPGRKGIAGRYWVLVPDRFRTFDDAPSDESSAKYFRENAGPNGQMTPLQSGDNPNGTALERSKEDLSPQNLGRNPDESAETTRTQPGRNPDESADHSSLTQIHLCLPLPPEQNGEAIQILEFDELLKTWNAANLPGAGKVQKSGNRAGWWQQRQSDEFFRANWREAIERAGRSARLCGLDGSWGGLRIDMFLKEPTWAARILEGEFDNRAPPAAPAKSKTQLANQALIDAAIRREAEKAP